MVDDLLRAAQAHEAAGVALELSGRITGRVLASLARANCAAVGVVRR